MCTTPPLNPCAQRFGRSERRPRNRASTTALSRARLADIEYIALGKIRRETVPLLNDLKGMSELERRNFVPSPLLRWRGSSDVVVHHPPHTGEDAFRWVCHPHPKSHYYSSDRTPPAGGPLYHDNGRVGRLCGRHRCIDTDFSFFFVVWRSRAGPTEGVYHDLTTVEYDQGSSAHRSHLIITISGTAFPAVKFPPSCASWFVSFARECSVACV